MSEAVFDHHLGDVPRVRLHPSRPVKVYARPRRLTGLLAGSCLLFSAMVGFAVLFPRQGEVPPEAPETVESLGLPAPVPGWRPLAITTPVFRLDTDPQPSSYEARFHEPGGGREDTLRLGTMMGLVTHAQLVLSRPGSEPLSPAGFYIDLVRRASQAGVSVIKTAQPGTLATKFGAAEAADVVLASDVERDCLAFRLNTTGDALRLHGWLCGTPDQPATRPALACLINSLVPASSKDAGALKPLFVSAEQRRDETCPAQAKQNRSRQASWMDEAPPPVLKGVKTAKR